MKTASFFVVIALTISAVIAQRPYDNSYPNSENSNRGYNSSPNGNYPNSYPNDRNSNLGNSSSGNCSNLNNLRLDDLQRVVYFKIHKGMETGALSWREAQNLNYALDRIDQKSRYFMADGFLSIQEENELRYDLLRLNDQAFYEKHDNNYGYGRGNNTNERHNWHERNRRSW